MFILTDGKNYVMENPMKQGAYISTTSSAMAKEFTWKQAKSLLQNKKKSMGWIRKYYVIDKDTGKVEKELKYAKSSGGAYVGKNNVEFNEEIIEKIFQETKSVIGLAGWSMTQLKTYKEELNIGLSKYDSAESDIGHALQKYKEDNEGKNAQAHKMAKIGYLLGEIREKHKNIKQCLDYIQVMEDAITYSYTIEKIKLELTKAKHTKYKGRTEYYQIALDLLD